MENDLHTRIIAVYGVGVSETSLFLVGMKFFTSLMSLLNSKGYLNGIISNLKTESRE